MDKAAIAALANIIQVINRIGTSADGSGVASLFGKLAAILADTSLIKGYTDQVEGYVDTLESSLATVLADLVTIKGYTDTLETKVGLNSDGPGTTTLFARLAQIAGYTDQVEGYVDTLETNLGAMADAANATGSVHAKLAYLITQSSNIKSWQRVTGATSAGTAKSFTISSVNPSKCLVFVEGCRFNGWNFNETTFYVPVLHYISAFDATNITLTISGSVSSTWSNGTLSVIIVEFN